MTLSETTAYSGWSAWRGPTGVIRDCLFAFCKKWDFQRTLVHKIDATEFGTEFQATE